MTLRRVGFFRELHPEPGLPSIRTAAHAVSHHDEGRVIAYLLTGVCLAACGGVQRDVFDRTCGRVTSPDLLTDCVWLWPGELAYYVTHYHVELPAAFVDSMRQNAWRVDVNVLTVGEQDTLFRELFPDPCA